ncbi:MAG TPA: putative sulfate exporter family transporter [Verrucomicrobiae bacterium]|jgi:uncharacterized integral membrane protein (TIGR00698 family)|nr:putative sulfate exporter family transporter [Verrucomicrobiae bacterium]
MTNLPGLIACVAIALIAIALGLFVPIVGGPVFGIAIGAIVAAAMTIPQSWKPGIALASKLLLQVSIVLLGANLSIREVASNGARSLPVMLGTLVLVLAASYVLGKALGIERDLRRLLGVGTAICGGSAIAAVATAIDAERADIAYALSTVFLFNIVAVLTFPAIGHAMHLTDHAFGLWAGTAINDTSSVVAAAFSYSHAAGSEAVIVKLTRTLLIVPIVLFYAGKRIFAARGTGALPWREIIPWFALWFVLATALNAVGAIPAAAHAYVQQAALFAIVVALAGVGLSADYARIKAAGVRPLVLGLLLWVLIAVSSLGIARFAGVA